MTLTTKPGRPSSAFTYAPHFNSWHDGARSEYMASKMDHIQLTAFERATKLMQREAAEWKEHIAEPHREFKRDCWYARYQAALEDRKQLEADCAQSKQEVVGTEEDETRLRIYEQWLVEYKSIMKRDMVRVAERTTSIQAMNDAEEYNAAKAVWSRKLSLDIAEGLEAAVRDERRCRIDIASEHWVETKALEQLYVDETSSELFADAMRNYVHFRLHLQQLSVLNTDLKHLITQRTCLTNIIEF